MGLSKKNLDKLNTFIKNKNLTINCNISKTHKLDNDQNTSTKLSNIEKSSNIFYSLIDNSETLDETTQVNNLLRDSENDCINITQRQSDYSKGLTTEEELYDEFNYLLDE